MAITITGNTEIGGAAVHVQLDPKATYLKTNNDPTALNAVAIDLVALGIAAGDLVVFEQTGDYDANGALPGLTDSSTGMSAVFSSSTTLTASSNLNRVSGATTALDFTGAALPNHNSQVTAFGNLPTNISQDLRVTDETIPIILPATATHVFFSADDSYFEDNTDPDNDWGVNIFRPMGVGISGIGTLTMAGGTEVSDGVIVGSTATGNGTLTINGGALFNIGGATNPNGVGLINGNLFVGLKGVGVTTISGGADVNLNQGGNGYSDGSFVGVGLGSGSTGTLTVTGAGSSLNLNGEGNTILIGDYGTGTFNVQSNAVVNALHMEIGVRNVGNVTINGGADVNITRNSGANETDSPSVRMAGAAGSSAIGLISGTGSSLNITQVGANAPNNYGPQLVVGQQGDATLTVESNAQINITGERAFLGVSTGWDFDGLFPSALLAQSELVIQSGADVVVNHGTTNDSWNVAAGGDAFSNGLITVTGAGSTLVSQGTNNAIAVGGSGTGVMNILAGADVTAQHFNIAANVGSTGTTTIDGLGSSLVLTGAAVFVNDSNASLAVGNHSTGTMTVRNAATVSLSGDRSQIHVGDGYNSPATGVLNIESGAVVTVDQGANSYWGTTVFAGQQVNATGTINIVGNGSKLVSIGGYRNAVTIGGRGTGFLNITAGADLEGKQLHVGDEAGGNGTVVIDGTGSSVVLTGPAVYSPSVRSSELIVGGGGNGTLTVRNSATIGLTGDGAHIGVGEAWDGSPITGTFNIQTGAVVTVNHGTNSDDNTTVRVGGNPNGTGILNISGAGSKLVSLGNQDVIRIGAQGNGTLNLSAGADIEGQQLRFGSDLGSIGTGIIDGLVTSVTLAGSAVYSANDRQAELIVGDKGNGTLTIRNSATMSLTGDRANIVVGANFGNYAGAGSGILNIQSGAVINVDHGNASANYGVVIVGGDQNSNGTINLTGPGSQLNTSGNQDEIVVGDRGTGMLNVTAGAVVNSQRMFLGMDATATGTVTVDGAGSAINLIGPNVFDPIQNDPALWVGNRGNGTMTVRNNAQVNITGAAAHLFVGDAYAAVGLGHTGIMTIQSGADVTVTNTDLLQQRGTIDIGNQQFGNGTLTVTGVGSTLTAAGSSPFINVGNRGIGVMNVQAGAVVKSLGMGLGDQSGSNGRLNIDGAGSKVVLSNDTHSGAFWGNTYGGFLGVGQSNGSYGRADITNGGVLEIRNTLSSQQAPGMTIGGDQGSVGILNVSGATSVLNVSMTGATGVGNYGPFINIGRKGDGTMTVSNGAQVNESGQSLFMQVSRGNNDGEVGAPARATLSELFVQSGADINLTASNGSYYGGGLVIGNKTNANGRVTIDGNGSSINISSDNTGNTSAKTAFFTVGNDGQGELVIQNGGDLVLDGGDDRRPIFNIANNPTAIGTATITGVGSTVSLSTTSTTADGGGLINIGRAGGANGILNILSGAVVTNDLGSTNSATVVGQSATATGALVVDGNGNATTLLDAGALLVVGAGWNGTSSLLASVSFAGGGTGSVAVRNAATIRADVTAVGSGGSITGNGTFDGSMTVDGGTISPGNSPGRLTVTGALNAINATLNMEVNGTTVATQYDQLKVNGAVTLGNMTLNLLTGAAFNFASGNSLVLIDGGTTLAANLATVTVNVIGEPATLAYALADAGNDLLFEALNSGTGAAIAKMGPASLIGSTASLDISTGLGSGTGGRFDTVRFVGATGLQGTLGADTLTLLGPTGGKLEGLAGIDHLVGTAAVDTLDGGADADVMTGGDGNDTYTVDNAGDNIIEATGVPAGAIDNIFSSVTFTNKANVERLFLTGTNAINATGLTTQADYLSGNTAANTLTGLGGTDYLDGKAGADTLVGGLNSDTYIVDDVGDVVTELAGASAGTMDIINASLSFTTFANVERLNLTGTGNFAATGLDGQADLLIGNSGNNTLSGLGGNDNLQGGLGTDTMIGGDGNDIFYVENPGDIVTELVGVLSGIDTIYSSVTITNFANVERVVLQGTSAINATGLDGQNDQLTGNAGVNTLTGGSGNDTLDGLGGADIMIGGDGNDSFYVDNAGDTITEVAGATAGTNDAVYSTVNFTNVANVERVTLAGIGNINATGFGSQNEIFFGNNGANVINGGDGVDLMSGGFGLDTLTGGLGNDSFRFDKNLNAATNKDAITDYNVANDTIQLDNAIFTQLFATLGNPTSTGTMHSSLFGFAATIDADDRIIYNATTGELAYDINGSVAGGATVFAQLGTGLAMTNLDFVVI